MIRIWDRRRGYVEPFDKKEGVVGERDKDTRKRDRQEDNKVEVENSNDRNHDDQDKEEGSSLLRPDVSREAQKGSNDKTLGRKPTAPPLICPELPRRLFRSLSTGSTTIPPLLEHLYSVLPTPPDANSHRGYPLCRAVLTRNQPLIRFLLKHGADPALRDGLAVEVAISGGDVAIVKLLVENDNHTLNGNRNESGDNGPKAGKKRRLSLSTRLEITPRLVEAAMRSGHDKIVQYFVHEKGEFLA